VILAGVIASPTFDVWQCVVACGAFYGGFALALTRRRGQ